MNNYKNLTLHEIKEGIMADNILTDGSWNETTKNLKVLKVSNYFTEKNNKKQDFEKFVMTHKNYTLYKAVKNNHIKYKVVWRYNGIDHVRFLTTEKLNKLFLELPIFETLISLINQGFVKKINDNYKIKMQKV